MQTRFDIYKSNVGKRERCKTSTRNEKDVYIQEQRAGKRKDA